MIAVFIQESGLVLNRFRALQDLMCLCSQQSSVQNIEQMAYKQSCIKWNELYSEIYMFITLLVTQSAFGNTDQRPDLITANILI